MTGGGRMAGFMLVETLAALTILSVVLIATYAALTNALAVSAGVAARREAVAIVEGQVEALRSRGRLQVDRLRGTAGSYRWRVEVSYLAATSGQRLRPLRITGQILPNGGAAAATTVVDTVLLVSGP